MFSALGGRYGLEHTGLTRALQIVCSPALSQDQPHYLYQYFVKTVFKIL